MRLGLPRRRCRGRGRCLPPLSVVESLRYSVLAMRYACDSILLVSLRYLWLQNRRRTRGGCRRCGSAGQHGEAAHVAGLVAPEYDHMLGLEA